MKQHKIYEMSFSQIYPLYIKKAERKNRTKEEVDQIIFWLTGYHKDSLQHQLDKKVDVRTFFDEAPKINSNASLIKGVICKVRVEDIDDPLMQKIRYLDKLVDELSKGKPLDKILRKELSGNKEI